MDSADRSYQWFLKFQAHHRALAADIKGIADEGDRACYATVILARLILICFLQTQGWLDQGDRWYLQNKLGQSQQRGSDQFYSEFLQCLFLQGFALPAAERTASTQVLIGHIPYLSGSLFQPHRLEQLHNAIAIADHSFESILDWLGDYNWQWHAVNDADNPGEDDDGANTGEVRKAVVQGIALNDDFDSTSFESLPILTLDLLQQSFQYAVTAASGQPYALSPGVIQATCDRVIGQQILDRVATVSDRTFKSLDILLSQLDNELATRLKQDILPRFRVLDPACGSGAFLMGAMQTLMPLYQAISTIAPASPSRYPAAVQATSPPQNPCLTLKRCILTDNLYGVDQAESAVELARLQLFLQVLSEVKQDSDLRPLPLIEFNLLPGNALIGLVQVDTEGFDQVGTKGNRAKGNGHVSANDQVLQGNLLQPLMAENYRTIVVEKQVSLEDYQTQTRLMAEVATIPTYAQSEFLRDHIQTLNQKAQNKLDRLLLNEFSQKLGIRYRQNQPETGTRKRVLTLADIQQLKPFHWGYHFHKIIANQGGFDVLLSDLPWGALRPTSQQFLSRYRHLAQRKQLDLKTFRRSRSQLLQQDAELSRYWSAYRSQLTYVRDYFRQATHYTHQHLSVADSSQSAPFYVERLFIERCFQLLQPSGTAAIFLPGNSAQGLRSGNLKDLLLQSTQLAPILICTNYHQLAQGLGNRHQLGLVQFKKTVELGQQAFDARSTRLNMHIYETVEEAPTPTVWGELL